MITHTQLIIFICSLSALFCFSMLVCLKILAGNIHSIQHLYLQLVEKNVQLDAKRNAHRIIMIKSAVLWFLDSLPKFKKLQLPHFDADNLLAAKTLLEESGLYVVEKLNVQESKETEEEENACESNRSNVDALCSPVKEYAKMAKLKKNPTEKEDLVAIVEFDEPEVVKKK